MTSQAQNPIQRLIGMVDSILFDEPKPQPRPKYSLNAQLQRSLIHEEIQESKAKLETFRAQETEFSAVLAAAYASMAYEAERARFSIELRKWNDGTSLAAQHELIESALDAHTDCLQEIASLEAKIEDAQGELDDAELWLEVK